MPNSPRSTVANASDEELAAASRRRLHAATRELVRRHAGPTFALCHRWLNQEEESHRACVEIFSQVFRNQEVGVPFRLKLLQITTRYLEGLEVPAILSREPVQKRSLEDLLAHCLSALEPEHRLILLLRDLTGLSTEGISKVLEIPEASALSRLSRARTELALQVARHSSPMDVV